MRSALILCALALAAIEARAQGTAADSAAIRETALNYVEGWYAGDAERMARALHPDLAKRIVRTDEAGASRLQSMDAEQLIEGTTRGFGRDTPEAERRRDVKILDIFGNVAAVRADMSGWIDYMHMARWNGEWRIVNVLWELRAP